jgi:hypothetical protein
MGMERLLNSYTLPEGPAFVSLSQSLLMPFRRVIYENLEKYKNTDKIHSKYKWLQSKYNAVVNKYPAIHELLI